jgi:hypothetical protein|tara:strand:- start:41 stop:499 length:459 start_codon:yes stop_codon:yes gene_type:complete
MKQFTGEGYIKTIDKFLGEEEQLINEYLGNNNVIIEAHLDLSVDFNKIGYLLTLRNTKEDVEDCEHTVSDFTDLQCKFIHACGKRMEDILLGEKVAEFLEGRIALIYTQSVIGPTEYGRIALAAVFYKNSKIQDSPSTSSAPQTHPQPFLEK